MLYYKSEIRMFVCVVNRREGRGGETISPDKFR